MTKKFDSFLHHITETLSFEENGLLKDEWKYFPLVSKHNLKNGIYLDDWDLKDFSEFKNLLHKADVEKKFIFGKAYPYETKNKMRLNGKNQDEINREFEKDTNRLIKLYSKFGFMHTMDGWVYRPFKNL